MVYEFFEHQSQVSLAAQDEMAEWLEQLGPARSAFERAKRTRDPDNIFGARSAQTSVIHRHAKPTMQFDYQQQCDETNMGVFETLRLGMLIDRLVIEISGETTCRCCSKNAILRAKACYLTHISIRCRDQHTVRRQP